MEKLDFIKKVLPAFTDDRRMQERGFFTNFFKVRPEYYTDSEFVEIDVERSGIKVAPVLRDRRTGSVIVQPDAWKENHFRPPYSAMRDPVDLSDLMQRQFGEDEQGGGIPVVGGNMTPRQVGDWYGRLANRFIRVLGKYHRMFLHQMEFQCAQVMQEGKISLKDENGVVVYDLDFGMKAEHKPTVSVSWSEANADPLADIEALADVVNDDGLATPSILVFGKNAWNNALKNQRFKEMLMHDGYRLGTLTPGLMERGGRYQGSLNIGSYRFEMYTYSGSYELMGDSTTHRFLDPDKVVITAPNEDLDFRLVFGGVPRVIGLPEAFGEVVPRTVTYPNSIKVYNRVYADVQNETYTVESKMRGLAVPVSIDRFGCLNTVVG